MDKYIFVNKFIKFLKESTNVKSFHDVNPLILEYINDKSYFQVKNLNSSKSTLSNNSHKSKKSSNNHSLSTIQLKKIVSATTSFQ